MWNRFGLWIVLAVMMLSGAAVMFGEMDESVSFSAAMEVWGDVIRDVDHIGLRLTHISDRREMELGRELKTEILPEFQVSSEWQPYVCAVGKDVAAHVRREGIAYEFHVVDSDWINAFAVPGGQIFITTGMLNFLESEAELAAILGHEIAHVDQRHCIEQYQAQIALQRAGLEEAAPLADLLHGLLAVGYQKYQELEADSAGMRLAVAAGYDPQATVMPFERMRSTSMEYDRPRYREPVGEVAGSLAETLGSYVDSHPPTSERIVRLRQLIATTDAWLRDRTFYVGKENYKRRIPKTTQEFPGETSTGD